MPVLDPVAGRIFVLPLLDKAECSVRGNFLLNHSPGGSVFILALAGFDPGGHIIGGGQIGIFRLLRLRAGLDQLRGRNLDEIVRLPMVKGDAFEPVDARNRDILAGLVGRSLHYGQLPAVAGRSSRSGAG
ncbi:hypothetical protein D3C71_1572380 [compost metagenome]